jgi:hypothetical protein
MNISITVDDSSPEEIIRAVGVLAFTWTTLSPTDQRRLGHEMNRIARELEEVTHGSRLLLQAGRARPQTRTDARARPRRSAQTSLGLHTSTRATARSCWLS